MGPVTIYKSNIADIVRNVIAIQIGIVPVIDIEKKRVPKPISWVTEVPSSIPTPIIPANIPTPSIPTPIVPTPSHSYIWVGLNVYNNI